MEFDVACVRWGSRPLLVCWRVAFGGFAWVQIADGISTFVTWLRFYFNTAWQTYNSFLKWLRRSSNFENKAYINNDNIVERSWVIREEIWIGEMWTHYFWPFFRSIYIPQLIVIRGPSITIPSTALSQTFDVNLQIHIALVALLDALVSQANSTRLLASRTLKFAFNQGLQQTVGVAIIPNVFAKTSDGQRLRYDFIALVGRQYDLSLDLIKSSSDATWVSTDRRVCFSTLWIHYPGPRCMIMHWYKFRTARVQTCNGNLSKPTGRGPILIGIVSSASDDSSLVRTSSMVEVNNTFLWHGVLVGVRQC